MSLVDIDQITKAFWERDWHRYVAPGDKLGDIDNSGIQVKVHTIKYSGFEPVKSPNIIGSFHFLNDSSATQEQTIQTSKKTSATFQWSVTEGIKVGAKVSGSVGLPLVAEGKVEASIELNFSSTQGQSETVEQQWSFSSKIPVPPMSVITADVTVMEDTYSPEFTAVIELTGNSRAFNESRRGNIIIGIAHMVQGIPGFTIKNDWSSCEYLAQGQFKGAQGISVMTNTKQRPLPSGFLSQYAAAIKNGEIEGAE